MRSACAGLFGWCLYGLSLSAHHSTLPFDGTRAVTLVGVVATLQWSHPHTQIVLDVEDDRGRTRQWTVESESPYLLARLGWTRESIKPGDRIRVVGAPARNGAPMLRCRTVELAEGTSLPCFPTYGRP
jgi:hypothetical protein